MSIKSKVYSLTEKSSLIKKLYVALHNAKVKNRMKLSDEEFAQTYYYSATKRKLNLENPQNFDEKQWWMKIHYRNPLMTQCVDKYLVRDYVKQCGLEHILNELYGAYDNAEQIDWNELPEEFFIKTNHGCGCNFWCQDKSNFPVKEVAKKLNNNLKENYYIQSREWPYKDVKPKIIAEKVLKSKKGEELVDYRFLCFAGKCHYVFVDIDTCADSGEHKVHAKRNVYDRDFKLLPIRVSRENFAADLVKKPGNYDEMVAYAEKLSEPFPFVRVDLYNIDGEIIFGELTFYHAGSSSIFNPWSFSDELGKLIELPKGEYVI